MSFKILIILVISLPSIVIARDSLFFPTKCTNFTDLRRNESRIGKWYQTVIRIPPHLTNGQDKELEFHLKSAGLSVSATEHETECKMPLSFNLSLTPDDAGRHGVSSNKYPLQDQWKFKNDIYFTSDGYLYVGWGQFLNPIDYCVQSISETKLAIKSCEVHCSADLFKSYLYTPTPAYESSRICLPKCCGVDETVSITDSTCRKLNNTEPNYFLPYFHLPQPIWYLKETNRPGVDQYKVLVTPQLSGVRKSWNSTHGFVGGSRSIWQNIHFSRSKMNCTNFLQYNVTFDDVQTPEKKGGNKYNFRVEVAPGQVQLAFLTRSRKWKASQKEFCVDGIDKWGEGVSEEAISQVVLVCVNDDTSKRLGSEEAHFDGGDSSISPVHYLYLVVTIFCASFLLFGTWMYFLIRNRLNLSGKLIWAHLGTVALSYVFTAVALSAESEYSRVGSNAVIVVNSDFDGYRRIGWFCVGVGTLCHFLYLSSFLWLSAFNNGLRKRIRQFWICGFFGWGIPAVFILAICLVDWVYNDPWSEAVVPDYGVESCHVASWSAGYYLHLPVALILGVNFLYILVKLGQNCRKERREDSNGGNSGCEGPPLQLFAMIWSAQFLGWLGSLVTWRRVYTGKEPNWATGLVLVVTTIFETGLLLNLYCMNEVVWMLAGEKFTRLQGLVKLLKNKKLIWKGTGKLGTICEPNAEDDTVIIEGEELLRK